MKLEFLITTVSAIHDSLSNILDSKNKDSGFHKQKIPDSFTSVNAPTFIFHLIMMTPGYKLDKTMKKIDEQQCPV